ncbi:MAG: substrate-binding domain-containing protein [Ostreibacterium sp.]
MAKSKNLFSAIVVSTLLLTTTGLTYAAPKEKVDLSKAVTGPYGYVATPASNITLSDDEVSQIKSKKLKAALVWHGSGNWVNALTRGAKDEFAKLGVDVVAETDAQYDAARQANDIETVLALSPDIILTLVLDGVSAEAAYKPAVDKGVKLVLLSNPISDYKPNSQYVGIVTDDMYGMGIAAAELIAQATNGKGKIGVIYHDANYFITNNRDNAFRTAILDKMEGFEGLEIVNEKGFTKESETGAIISTMLLQNPEISAVYVAWDGAAEAVIEVLRSNGRTDVKVVTHDLGANDLLDMALNGSMYGTVADRPFEIGQAMAKLGAYGILGKKAPEFSIVSFDKVTKINITKVWEKSFKSELPKTLKKVLDKK